MKAGGYAQQRSHASGEISPHLAAFDNHKLTHFDILPPNVLFPAKNQERAELRCEVVDVFVRSGCQTKKFLEDLPTGLHSACSPVQCSPWLMEDKF